MARAASLSVDFVAGLGQLQTGFAQVERETAQLGQRMQANFDRVNGAVGQLSNTLNSLGLGQAGSTLESLSNAATSLASAIGSGPVGLVARVAALTAAVGAGILVWNNWRAAIDNVNQSLSRNARARVGGQVTAEGTVDFEDFIAGFTGGSQGVRTDPDAVRIIDRFNQEQTRLRQQLQLDRSTLDDLRSSAEQVRAARELDADTFIPPALLRRAQDYEAALARIAQNQERLTNAERLRDQALNVVLGRGLPTPPIPPEGDSGGGGGTRQRTPDEQFFDRIRSSEDPMLVAQRRITELDRLFESGEVNLSQYQRGLAEIGRQAGVTGNQAQQLQQPLTEMQLVLVGFSDDLAKTITGPLFDAEADIGKSLLNILRRVTEFALQMLVIKPLLQQAVGFLPSWFGGPGGGSIGGSNSGVSGNSYAGQRAGGGSVFPGSAYMVGEFGPERFVPNTPGRIVPGAEGAVTITVNNNGSNTRATAQERRNPFGGRDITILVEDMVNQAISAGRFDKAMTNSFGAARIGRV